MVRMNAGKAQMPPRNLIRALQKRGLPDLYGSYSRFKRPGRSPALDTPLWSPGHEPRNKLCWLPGIERTKASGQSYAKGLPVQPCASFCCGLPVCRMALEILIFA